MADESEVRWQSDRLYNQGVITLRLRQIRDFVAVVESGSIRAAARKLGVSQPAVTKSVRGLEAELHVRFLRRTPQGVVPTQSGRAFFARARLAQAELLKAEEEATQGGGSGSVAFGVGPTAGFMIVPEAIVRFRQEFPIARIRIEEGFLQQHLPLVRDETLDFAIAPRPAGKLDPAFVFRPLFRQEFIVVARTGHPLLNARSLAQLAGADWINFGPPDAPGGPLERAFSSAGLPFPKQAIQCGSYHSALGLFARTDTLGIVSRRMLTYSSARDLLQEIRVKEPMPSYTAGMFMRADPPLTTVAAAMAKAITAAARALTRSA
jgi:LysR family transcriptional regulator, regulator of abg operon